MPSPISSANSSVYDRTQLVSDASGDSSTMSWAPEPPVKVVTIEPVLIEGEASRNDLVAAYEQSKRRVPECQNEALAAAVGCGAAALSTASTLAAAPTGIGLAVGMGATVVNVTNCWRLIDAYNDCRELGAARAEVAERCEERGGVPLSGVADNELVCLMVTP